MLKCIRKRATNGEYYNPFAEHPRFKFWAYDRLRRHRSLEQSRIFMKQNPNETNLTIEDLKAKISLGDGKMIIKLI